MKEKLKITITIEKICEEKCGKQIAEDISSLEFVEVSDVEPEVGSSQKDLQQLCTQAGFKVGDGVAAFVLQIPFPFATGSKLFWTLLKISGIGIFVLDELAKHGAVSWCMNYIHRLFG